CPLVAEIIAAKKVPSAAAAIPIRASEISTSIRVNPASPGSLASPGSRLDRRRPRGPTTANQPGRVRMASSPGKPMSRCSPEIGANRRHPDYSTYPAAAWSFRWNRAPEPFGRTRGGSVRRFRPYAPDQDVFICFMGAVSAVTGGRIDEPAAVGELQDLHDLN